jgi:DNA-binding NarL/FixJ family response regulator
MDIRMPRMDGIEATRRILGDEGPGDTRVIILTTYDLDHYVYAALTAGASGFLLKDVTPEHLVAAVRSPGEWCDHCRSHYVDIWSRLHSSWKKKNSEGFK